MPVPSPSGPAPEGPAAGSTSSQPPVGVGDSPRYLVGFLVTFEGDELGRFWPLYQGIATLGRKGSGEVLDIALDHPTTSSRHAQLVLEGRPGRAKIFDLGSTNGTYVNDQRLQDDEHRPLATGDILRFGGFSAKILLA